MFAVTIELGWEHLVGVVVASVTTIVTNVLFNWWENR